MPPRKHRLTSNAGSRRRPVGKRSAIALSAAILLMALAGFANAQAAHCARKPNQIQFEYVAPKDPAHQMMTHDEIKEGRALEHLQQLLSPLRLPYPADAQGRRLRTAS